MPIPPAARMRVAALLALLCAPGFAAGQNWDGRRITAIHFEPSLQPLPDTQLFALLPLKQGDTYTSADIRRAIQRLYATGEYTDIAVDASADGQGVLLRFITTQATFVGEVGVRGAAEPPGDGQLETASRLELGTRFVSQQVQQAVENMQDALRRNGLYKAAIEPVRTPHPLTQQMDIDFDIDSGKRARFDGIQVTGNPQRTVAEIIHSSGWRWPWNGPWRTVTDARVQSGVDSIRGWYQKKDRLLAHVTLTRLDFHPETNRVTPTLDINAGPLVRVNVSGARISQGRLRSMLPIYQERAVDEDLLIEGSNSLVEYMQSHGYFDARARYTTHTDRSGEEEITYEVERGGRHKFVLLKISGNRYFTTATIRERMYLEPARFIRYPRGRYSREYVERDLDAIRDLYRSNGFRDVQVTGKTVDNYGGKPDHLAVFINIEEGPQWFVSRLILNGVSPEDAPRIRPLLHCTEGQPFSELNVASDRDAILDYYYNNGYQNARFDYVARANPTEANHMEVTFNVTPGERRFVRRVIVMGLDRTNPDLVDSRITLRPGDPISAAQMNESQRRLYDLGIFSKVQTALQNPDGDEPSKYVLYDVEEAHKYSMNVGFGATIGRIGGGTTDLNSPAGTTGFAPRVSLGVSRINVLGLANTVSVQTLLSTFEQRGLLSYLAPQIFGRQNLDLQFTGLYEYTRDVRTFTARRYEASVQLSQHFTRALTLAYRLAFRRSYIIGTPLISPELLPLLSQPVRVGAVSTSIIYDRRENPIDPHRGIYNTVDLALASPALGSQTGYGRITARNATYHPIGRNLVFARQTQFGDLERYSGLITIPLAERFFSGGADSERGFPDYQAGPRDPKTGFPIGGTAYFFDTEELRFPLIGDNIGGVLFHDMGNVYTNLGALSLRYHQNNLQDFDYAVQTGGFGIRYRTPIGPIRLDLAFSPNSPRFFGYHGTYEQLLFGTGTPELQRISRFQFHFSLGQTF
ncbi:MAG TPA: POTRA domain-containing protein [Bryobacteraceae bacterium]|nr:POTRA domain-containing protein [Bryobacteraceae bacterium]